MPWKHTFLSLCCLVAAQPGLPVPTYRAASKTSPVCTGRSQLHWQPVWCQSAHAVETMNLPGTKTVTSLRFWAEGRSSCPSVKRIGLLKILGVGGSGCKEVPGTAACVMTQSFTELFPLVCPFINSCRSQLIVRWLLSHVLLWGIKWAELQLQ